MRILPGAWTQVISLRDNPLGPLSHLNNLRHILEVHFSWVGRDSQGWTSVEKLEAAGDCGVGVGGVVVMKLLSSLVRHMVGCWGYSAEPNIHMCSDNTNCLCPSIHPSFCLSELGHKVERKRGKDLRRVGKWEVGLIKTRYIHEKEKKISKQTNKQA